MSFVLTSLGIAVQKGLVSVLKNELRVGAMCASQPAGQNEKRYAENYG
jgi:hypothetical protein